MELSTEQLNQLSRYTATFTLLEAKLAREEHEIANNRLDPDLSAEEAVTLGKIKAELVFLLNHKRAMRAA